MAEFGSNWSEAEIEKLNEHNKAYGEELRIAADIAQSTGMASAPSLVDSYNRYMTVSGNTGFRNTADVQKEMDRQRDLGWQPSWKSQQDQLAYQKELANAAVTGIEYKDGKLVVNGSEGFLNSAEYKKWSDEVNQNQGKSLRDKALATKINESLTEAINEYVFFQNGYELASYEWGDDLTMDEFRELVATANSIMNGEGVFEWGETGEALTAKQKIIRYLAQWKNANEYYNKTTDYVEGQTDDAFIPGLSLGANPVVTARIVGRVAERSGAIPAVISTLALQIPVLGYLIGLSGQEVVAEQDAREQYNLNPTVDGDFNVANFITGLKDGSDGWLRNANLDGLKAFGLSTGGEDATAFEKAAAYFIVDGVRGYIENNKDEAQDLLNTVGAESVLAGLNSFMEGYSKFFFGLPNLVVSSLFGAVDAGIDFVTGQPDDEIFLFSDEMKQKIQNSTMIWADNYPELSASLYQVGSLASLFTGMALSFPISNAVSAFTLAKLTAAAAVTTKAVSWGIKATSLLAGNAAQNLYIVGQKTADNIIAGEYDDSENFWGEVAEEFFWDSVLTFAVPTALKLPGIAKVGIARQLQKTAIGSNLLDVGRRMSAAIMKGTRAIGKFPPIRFIADKINDLSDVRRLAKDDYIDLVKVGKFDEAQNLMKKMDYVDTIVSRRGVNVMTNDIVTGQQLGKSMRELATAYTELLSDPAFRKAITTIDITDVVGHTKKIPSLLPKEWREVLEAQGKVSAADANIEKIAKNLSETLSDTENVSTIKKIKELKAGYQKVLDAATPEQLKLAEMVSIVDKETTAVLVKYGYSPEEFLDQVSKSDNYITLQAIYPSEVSLIREGFADVSNVKMFKEGRGLQLDDSVLYADPLLTMQRRVNKAGQLVANQIKNEFVNELLTLKIGEEAVQDMFIFTADEARRLTHLERVIEKAPKVVKATITKHITAQNAVASFTKALQTQIDEIGSMAIKGEDLVNSVHDISHSLVEEYATSLMNSTSKEMASYIDEAAKAHNITKDTAARFLIVDNPAFKTKLDYVLGQVVRNQPDITVTLDDAVRQLARDNASRMSREMVQQIQEEYPRVFSKFSTEMGMDTRYMSETIVEYIPNLDLASAQKYGFKKDIAPKYFRDAAAIKDKHDAVWYAHSVGGYISDTTYNKYLRVKNSFDDVSKIADTLVYKTRPDDVMNAITNKVPLTTGDIIDISNDMILDRSGMNEIMTSMQKRAAKAQITASEVGNFQRAVGNPLSVEFSGRSTVPKQSSLLANPTSHNRIIVRGVDQLNNNKVYRMVFDNRLRLVEMYADGRYDGIYDLASKLNGPNANDKYKILSQYLRDRTGSDELADGIRILTGQRNAKSKALKLINDFADDLVDAPVRRYLSDTTDMIKAHSVMENYNLEYRKLISSDKLKRRADKFIRAAKAQALDMSDIASARNEAIRFFKEKAMVTDANKLSGVMNEKIELSNKLEGAKKAVRANLAVPIAVDGQRAYITVADPIVAKMIQSPYRITAKGGFLYNAMTKMSSIYATMTTGSNPIAFIRNVLRDPWQAYISGGLDFFDPRMLSAPKEFMEAKLLELGYTKADLDYANSVMQANTVDLSEVSIAQNRVGNSDLLKDIKSRTNKIKDIVEYTKMPLQKQDQIMRDTVFRSSLIEELETAKALGKNMDINTAIINATFKANNATTNFAHGVGFMQDYIRTVPYLSSSINGTRSFYRMWELDPIGVTYRIIAGAATPVLWMTMNNISTRDKQEIYENIPQWSKDSNMIFISDDGTMISVPIPQEVRPFTSFIRRMAETANDINPEAFNTSLVRMFLDLAPLDLTGFLNDDGEVDFGLGITRLASEITPGIASFGFELMTGKNPYTGNETYLAESPVLNSLSGLVGEDIAKTINVAGENFLGSNWKLLVGTIDSFWNAADPSLKKNRTRDVLEAISREFFGQGYNQANNVFQQRVRELNDKKNKLLDELGGQEYNIYNKSAEETKKIREKIEKKKKDYLDEVRTVLNKYRTVYQISGEMTEDKRNQVLRLLNFTKDDLFSTVLYSEETYIGQAVKDENSEANRIARNTYEELGLPSLGLTNQDLGYYNSDGEFVKPTSYDWQRVNDRYTGTTRQMKTDFERLKNGESVEGEERVLPNWYDVMKDYQAEWYALQSAQKYDEANNVTLAYLKQEWIPRVKVLVDKYGAAAVIGSSTILDDLDDLLFRVPQEYTGIVSSQGGRLNITDGFSKPFIRDLYGMGPTSNKAVSEARAQKVVAAINADLDAARISPAKVKATKLRDDAIKGVVQLSPEDYDFLNRVLRSR